MLPAPPRPASQVWQWVQYKATLDGSTVCSPGERPPPACLRRQRLECRWGAFGIGMQHSPLTASSAANDLRTRAFLQPSPALLPCAELVRLVIEEELQAVRKELGSTEK